MIIFFFPLYARIKFRLKAKDKSAKKQRDIAKFNLAIELLHFIRNNFVTLPFKKIELGI
jgi:hypothetical protein